MARVKLPRSLPDIGQIFACFEVASRWGLAGPAGMGLAHASPLSRAQAPCSGSRAQAPEFRSALNDHHHIGIDVVQNSLCGIADHDSRDTFTRQRPHDDQW